MTRESRREEIVKAAYGLLADAGFEGFRVRTVAERVGINHATLLHYFSTKEALVEAVLQHMLEKLQQEGYSHGNVCAMDAICREFADSRRRLVEHPEFFVVLSELQLRAHRAPLIAAALERMNSAWRQYLTHLLQRGIENGEFQPDLEVDTMVNVLIMQFRGFGLLALDPPDEKSLDNIMQTECAMLRRWLLTK
ncbi:MAG: TetR/AcrR family transcriptional regulator [Bacilli bacterium]